MTSVTVYDGNSTIGGNKIYVEQEGRGVFLDFGMNFAKYNVFFEEFLNYALENTVANPEDSNVSIAR